MKSKSLGTDVGKDREKSSRIGEQRVGNYPVNKQGFIPHYIPRISIKFLFAKGISVMINLYISGSL